MNRRHIVYVTGTRADFGLLQSTLKLIHESECLHLSVIATGMHLSPNHGFTITEIEAAGLPVGARITVDDDGSTGATMARNIGRMLLGFVDAMERLKPDIVLVLGDRGEMLAGALAAIHLNIPVAHIHGGERSGTVDEPVRHAISKLSHVHFVATAESANRLAAMGERPDRIFVVGAPGLDGMVQDANSDKADLYRKYGLDDAQKLAMFLFHPVIQEEDCAGNSSAAILDALTGLQVLALKPNSDAGSDVIRRELEARASRAELSLTSHLPRNDFLSFLRFADVLVGNSSSGIIEAATFNIPVLNIGSRQNLRQRNANVIDVPICTSDIQRALQSVLLRPRGDVVNVYGDGHAGPRIVERLANLSLLPELMYKANAY